MPKGIRKKKRKKGNNQSQQVQNAHNHNLIHSQIEKEKEKKLWEEIIKHNVWTTVTQSQNPAPTSLDELVSVFKHTSPIEQWLFQHTDLFQKHGIIKHNSAATIKRRILALEKPTAYTQRKRIRKTLPYVVIRYKILHEILLRCQKNNDLIAPVTEKIQELIELCKEIIDQLDPTPQEEDGKSHYWPTHERNDKTPLGVVSHSHSIFDSKKHYADTDQLLNNVPKWLGQEDNYTLNGELPPLNI